MKISMDFRGSRSTLKSTSIYPELIPGKQNNMSNSKWTKSPTNRLQSLKSLSPLSQGSTSLSFIDDSPESAKDKFLAVESSLKGRLSPIFPMFVVESHEKSLLKDTRKMLKSHALECESRLRECTVMFSNSKLESSLVQTCLSILDEIALGPGPYNKVLREVSQHLNQAIYINPLLTPNIQPSEAAHMTYFQLCEHFKTEFRKLEAEKVELQHKVLASEASSRSLLQSIPRQFETDDSGERAAVDDGYAAASQLGSFRRNASAYDLDSESSDSPHPHYSGQQPRSTPSLLKKTDLELKSKVIQLQVDLEHNMHLRKEAEKVATDLKGAFLRLKRDYIDVQDRLQSAEAQCQALFISMQGLRGEAPARDGQGDADPYDAEDAVAAGGGSARGGELTPRPNWFGVGPEVRVACNLVPGKDRSAAAVRKLVLAFRKLHRQHPPEASGGEDADGARTGPEVAGAAAAGDDGALVKRIGRFIPCLGTGPDVPAYLRFQGSVRNRNMSKRDAERAVRDIWAKKMLSDRESAGGPRQSMEDFFYSYARKKFGAFPNLIAEWSYNLIAVLERNAVDNDCDLFLKVLRGFLSEDVYYAQLQQIAECERLAAECDRAMHAGSALGVAGKRPFLAALQARFGKSEAAIAELKRALDSVYGPHSELFAYGSLFAEDREMNQNDFGEAFRDQMLHEREEQNAAIMDLVDGLRDKDGWVSTLELRAGLRALVSADSDADAQLLRGCGLNLGPLGPGGVRGGPPLPERVAADEFLVRSGIRG